MAAKKKQVMPSTACMRWDLEEYDDTTFQIMIGVGAFLIATAVISCLVIISIVIEGQLNILEGLGAIAAVLISGTGIVGVTRALRKIFEPFRIRYARLAKKENK